MSRIETYYVENGAEEHITRQLIAGRLHLMGHEMWIYPETTNSQLSEFLGVKVLSWEMK